jgi:GAF domain-containing protein
MVPSVRPRDPRGGPAVLGVGHPALRSGDPRFADNPFVTGDFHLRFYAGVPLHGPTGKAIGALSLVDTKPHQFSAKQLGRLKKLAALVETQFPR